MPLYKIEIIETSSVIADIQADSLNEAISEAKRQYYSDYP